MFSGDNGNSEDSGLGDYLLSFAGLEQDAARAMFDFAVGAVKQCGLANRTVDRRLATARGANDAVDFVLGISGGGSWTSNPSIGDWLATISRAALAVAETCLSASEEMCSFDGREKELKICLEMVRLVRATLLSNLASIEDRDAISEALLEFQQSVNRANWRVIDPSRYEFEWIDAFELRVGAKLSQIAVDISWMTEQFYRDSRPLRPRNSL